MRFVYVDIQLIYVRTEVQFVSMQDINVNMRATYVSMQGI